MADLGVMYKRQVEWKEKLEMSLQRRRIAQRCERAQECVTGAGRFKPDLAKAHGRARASGGDNSNGYFSTSRRLHSHCLSGGGGDGDGGAFGNGNGAYSPARCSLVGQPDASSPLKGGGHARRLHGGGGGGNNAKDRKVAASACARLYADAKDAVERTKERCDAEERIRRAQERNECSTRAGKFQPATNNRQDPRWKQQVHSASSSPAAGGGGGFIGRGDEKERIARDACERLYKNSNVDGVSPSGGGGGGGRRGMNGGVDSLTMKLIYEGGGSSAPGRVPSKTEEELPQGCTWKATFKPKLSKKSVRLSSQFAAAGDVFERLQRGFEPSRSPRREEWSFQPQINRRPRPTGGVRPPAERERFLDRQAKFNDAKKRKIDTRRAIAQPSFTPTINQSSRKIVRDLAKGDAAAAEPVVIDAEDWVAGLDQRSAQFLQRRTMNRVEHAMGLNRSPPRGIPPQDHAGSTAAVEDESDPAAGEASGGGGALLADMEARLRVAKVERQKVSTDRLSTPLERHRPKPPQSQQNGAPESGERQEVAPPEQPPVPAASRREHFGAGESVDDRASVARAFSREAATAVADPDVKSAASPEREQSAGSRPPPSPALSSGAFGGVLSGGFGGIGGGLNNMQLLSTPDRFGLEKAVADAIAGGADDGTRGGTVAPPPSANRGQIQAELQEAQRVQAEVVAALKNAEEKADESRRHVDELKMRSHTAGAHPHRRQQQEPDHHGAPPPPSPVREAAALPPPAPAAVSQSPLRVPRLNRPVAASDRRGVRVDCRLDGDGTFHATPSMVTTGQDKDAADRRLRAIIEEKIVLEAWKQHEAVRVAADTHEFYDAVRQRGAGAPIRHSRSPARSVSQARPRSASPAAGRRRHDHALAAPSTADSPMGQSRVSSFCGAAEATKKKKPAPWRSPAWKGQGQLARGSAAVPRDDGTLTYMGGNLFGDAAVDLSTNHGHLIVSDAHGNIHGGARGEFEYEDAFSPMRLLASDAPEKKSQDAAAERLSAPLQRHVYPGPRPLPPNACTSGLGRQRPPPSPMSPSTGDNGRLTPGEMAVQSYPKPGAVSIGHAQAWAEGQEQRAREKAQWMGEARRRRAVQELPRQPMLCVRSLQIAEHARREGRYVHKRGCPSDSAPPRKAASPQGERSADDRSEGDARPSPALNPEQFPFKPKMNDVSMRLAAHAGSFDERSERTQRQRQRSRSENSAEQFPFSPSISKESRRLVENDQRTFDERTAAHVRKWSAEANRAEQNVMPGPGHFLNPDSAADMASEARGAALSPSFSFGGKNVHRKTLEMSEETVGWYEK